MNKLPSLRSINEQLDLLAQQIAPCKNSLGYPINLELDFLAPLQRFMLYPFNNLGSPFGAIHNVLYTWSYEREVLSFVADLYQFPPEQDTHGYVTSGGTEGNLQGLLLGRTHYPEGRLYFSSASHYSIPKIARLLRMPHHIIPEQANGEMDYAALAAEIALHADQAVILSLNIGTTMKGAIDDVTQVLAVLQQQQIENFYIHCDAALFGMMLPFLPNAPQLSFQQHHIHSLAISGHKFLGSPFPCGIVLSRYETNVDHIEYVKSLDTTILGSRNGHTPLILWYTLQTKGYEGLRQEAHTCIANAHYLYNRLTALNYPCFINLHSNTVLLKTPHTQLVRKWDLAIEGDWAHIVTMQHVTRPVIDQFLHDLTHSLQPKSTETI